MAQWSEVVTAMGVAWLAKVRTRRPYAAWRHTATPLPLPDRPEKAGSAKRKRPRSSNRPRVLKNRRHMAAFNATRAAETETTAAAGADAGERVSSDEDV